MRAVFTFFSYTVTINPHVLIFYHISEFVGAVLYCTLIRCHQGLETITRFMPDELIGVYEVTGEVFLNIDAPYVPLNVFGQRTHVKYSMV